MNVSTAQILANIAAVRARNPSQRGDTTDAEQPSEDWRSDWDADRAAEKWENEVTRCWP